MKKSIVFTLICFLILVMPVVSEAQLINPPGITEVYSVNQYGAPVLQANSVQVGNVIEMYSAGKSVQRVELAQDPYSYNVVYDLSGGQAVKALEYRTNSLGVNEIIDYTNFNNGFPASEKTSGLMEYTPFKSIYDQLE